MQTGKVLHTLQKERRTHAIISIFFALSYFGRFYVNEYHYCDIVSRYSFATQMTLALVYMLEGASMGVLMWFHFVNFKYGSLL